MKMNTGGCKPTAAQSELAALREDRDKLHAMGLEYSEQVVDLKYDLTAAEQRNAEHESMLRHFASCADVRRVGTFAMGYVAALNKPTESGASE